MKVFEPIHLGHSEAAALGASGEPPTTQAETSGQRLQRREWWLWFATFVVTALATIAFLLASFPSLFPEDRLHFGIRDEQADWGTMSLLLLFNTWMIYRQWCFRQERIRTRRTAGAGVSAPGVEDPSTLDPLTGFYTRANVEQRLARETAFARRQKTALSLVALHVEDLEKIAERFSRATAEQVLRDFARRLKKAIRGTDFGARMGDDDFLLVLPECSLSAAKLLTERLGVVEMKWAGQNIPVTYSAGWIDYQAGELPGSLLARAEEVLRLYKQVSNETLPATVAAG